MAISNDTGTFCPNVLTEHAPTSPFGRPFHGADTDSSFQLRTHNDLASISMAINVLTGILANSDTSATCRHATCRCSTANGHCRPPASKVSSRPCIT